MEASVSDNESIPKKRGRKKQLYKIIRSQMEFYFSASNLSKDRWLNQKLEEENAIPLTEFLKFNKIRALTQDVNDLAKSLKHSEIITVTEDMKVKRNQPVKYKENEDDYVIYIEQVPPDADHEWLSSLFSRYGKIDYVSIPKFRNSGKCKGFAFIEYSEVESAERAIKDYKENGNYLSTDIEPAELMSIATYEEPNREETVSCETNVNNIPEILNVVSEVETYDKDKLPCKRKMSDTYEDLHNKKLKTEEAVVEKIKTKEERNSEQDDATVNESGKDDGNVINTEHDEGNTDESKKKKNRKKKSKKKKTKDDTENTGLQILSKKDWKKLRNKYLNMQKEKMKQLKKHIFLAKKKAETCKKNGVFKNNEKSSEHNEVEKTKKTGNYSFSHGLIVKVKFNEPVVEMKELKNDMKKNKSLLFVDLKEGENVMYLRFASSEAALEFCQNSSWPKTKILKGEKEMAYWNKIQEQREEKLSKNVKKKERGKDKLMRKAENILGKHITFD